MIHLDCLRAMGIADATTAGVEDADRLRLEEHLSKCDRCSGDVALLGGVVRASRDVAPLEPSARERALARAFRARKSADDGKVGGRSASRERTWAVAGVFASGLALGAIVAVLGVRASNEAERHNYPTGDPVEEAEQPARIIEASDGETVVVEHAKVTAIGDSVLRWTAETSTLHVDRGEVRVDVEPNRQVPFTVVTSRFSVHVLGTIFTVLEDDVVVERGRVLVESTDRATKPAVLGAGERWTMMTSAAPSVSAEPVASAEPAPSADPSAKRTDAPLLFAQARKHLAAGDAKRARRLVDQAMATKLSPAQHAEAQTLLAECALVAGNPEEASRRYAEVAKQHPDLPAAETALFAAARSAHQSGKTSEARKLLNEYLSRYPAGTFHKEARKRLAQVPSN